MYSEASPPTPTFVTLDSTSSTIGALKKSGQAIEFAVLVDDTLPTFFVTACIFKDAPHANAAKLFLAGSF
jgi:hypothetical protein